MVLFNEMREKRNTEVDEPAGQERNVVNSGNGRGGAAVNGGRGGSGIGRGVANSGNGRDGGIFFYLLQIHYIDNFFLDSVKIGD